MHVYGLTGGIASGKSTVSGMLRELGATVLDADVLAREVVEPGTPGLAAVSARFPGVLREDGRLDRARLAARIFSDPAERAALNALLHPLIKQEFLRRTWELAEQGVERVLYDAPLLIENRLHESLEGVVLVWVPRSVQKARLMARDKLDEASAEARLAAQMPLEDKRPFARWIVDNSTDLASTRAQVESIWQQILAQG
jgi:dephospho-CoA kinase